MAARARLPQQRGGARRGDRASVDRKGRLWTAAPAGRREFGCARRRSAKAALDGCPSYSGGRLRRLPGACGCAEYCSRVYLTRRRNGPKNPFFQEDSRRAERRAGIEPLLADWRASREGIPATLRLVSKTSTRAAAAGPKPNSTHLLPNQSAVAAASPVALVGSQKKKCASARRNPRRRKARKAGPRSTDKAAAVEAAL